MGDRDPFGMSCRARSVKNVAERVGRRGALVVAERRAARRRDLLSLLVKDESPNCTIGKSVGDCEMGDDERRGCIAEDVAYAFSRVIGVERNIGCARLHQRDERGVGLQPAVEQHRDPIARLDAPCDEELRHLIGAGVDLGEGDIRAVDGDRGAVGELAAGAFDDVVEPLAIAPAQRRGVAKDRQRARVAEAAMRYGNARHRSTFGQDRWRAILLRLWLGPVCRRFRHRFDLPSSRLTECPRAPFAHGA